jgi:hypothetical protein
MLRNIPHSSGRPAEKWLKCMVEKLIHSHNRCIDTVGGVHVILRYLPRSMSEKVEIQGRIVASIVGAVAMDYSM